jgi:phosphopantothenoylcysteine decarboxylase/phosphopantothenate--cysteine ligase
MIAGNLVNDPSSGFNVDTNKINLFFKDGSVEELTVMDKDAAAHVLLDRVNRIMKKN